jgi:hypothetical protein
LYSLSKNESNNTSIDGVNRLWAIATNYVATKYHSVAE